MRFSGCLDATGLGTGCVWMGATAVLRATHCTGDRGAISIPLLMRYGLNFMDVTHGARSLSVCYVVWWLCLSEGMFFMRWYCSCKQVALCWKAIGCAGCATSNVQSPANKTRVEKKFFQHGLVNMHILYPPLLSNRKRDTHLLSTSTTYVAVQCK